MIGDWFRIKPLSLNRIPKLRSDSVFILGNGPSLNEHNLDSLEGVPTFASNAIYLVFEKTKWRPDFYRCVDTVELPVQKDEISHWARKLRRSVFFFPRTIFPHETPLVSKNVDEVIKPRKNVCFFDTHPLDFDGGPRPGVVNR